MVLFEGMSKKDKENLDDVVQFAGIILSMLLTGVTIYNALRFFDRLEDEN